MDRNRDANREEGTIAIIDYSVIPNLGSRRIASFLAGFAAGFAVLFVFYKVLPLSFLGGAVAGFWNISLAGKKASKRRLAGLRTQFYDLLEAMSVSMRAGNPPYKALVSAREDLLLLYSEAEDIVVELDLIIGRFQNAVPLSQAFLDFANRSGLEDIASFASIYATIEGKSSRADEIIRETQEIIMDKMGIEMEIDTLMTAAKSEVNIMLAMPLVILVLLGYVGAGFLDAIYTTAIGRAAATVGLLMFIASYFLAQKFSNVEL